MTVLYYGEKRMIKNLTTCLEGGFGCGLCTGDTCGCLCRAPNSAGPLLSTSMFSIIPSDSNKGNLGDIQVAI